MKGRHERRARWRSKLRAGSNVNLISMMDILTVLLLFLLKSYVAGGEVMVPPAGVRLPASSADTPPPSSVVVAINGDEILLGNEHVASVEEAVSNPDLLIGPLASRLVAARAQQDEIARLQGDTNPHHVATIQGDKEIEFRLLKRVMFTLNQSGYDDIALAVLQKT
jgi:biopolymer transport protein TolR